MFLNFEAARPCSENKFLVKKDGRWLYANRNGSNIFEGKTFEDAEPFFNGTASVKENGRWFVINEYGEEIEGRMAPNDFIGKDGKKTDLYDAIFNNKTVGIFKSSGNIEFRTPDYSDEKRVSGMKEEKGDLFIKGPIAISKHNEAGAGFLIDIHDYRSFTEENLEFKSVSSFNNGYAIVEDFEGNVSYVDEDLCFIASGQSLEPTLKENPEYFSRIPKVYFKKPETIEKLVNFTREAFLAKLEKCKDTNEMINLVKKAESCKATIQEIVTPKVAKQKIEEVFGD